MRKVGAQQGREEKEEEIHRHKCSRLSNSVIGLFVVQGV